MATETLPTPRWAAEDYEGLVSRESIRALDPAWQCLQRNDSGPIDDDEIRASIEATGRQLSRCITTTRLYLLQPTADHRSTFVPAGRSLKGVARYEPESMWQKIDDKLTSFSALEKGWDGYDALPPSKLARENAREFVAVLSLAKLLPNRCKPSVVGGVGVTIKNGSRKVYVEFYNNGSAHSLKSDGKGEPITESVGIGYSHYLRFIRRIVGYLNA